ncbi:MAG: hypothetical protein VB118_02665 [Oscillospiraceae bacterium]|nr:hypothetical protein [Oscillospiraceae bacterium]
MRYTIKICDKKIALEIPPEIKITEYGKAAKFLSEDKSGAADHLCFFEIVNKIPEISGDILYISESVEISFINGKYYRFYKEYNKETPVACLINDAYETGTHISNVLIKQDFVRFINSLDICLNFIGFEEIITGLGMLMMHASAIIYKNEAILFSAPSNTGKSTQSELWRNIKKAEYINGDKTAIYMSTHSRILACGIPFSGMSAVCENISAPLKAIVFLSQSTVNSIKTPDEKTAFKLMLKNAVYNEWDINKLLPVMDIIEKTIKTADIVEFGCVPDESAVNALDGYLYPNQ